MSTVTEEIENEEINSEEELEDGATDLVQLFLDKLVPPTEVKIQDLYGQEYELRTKISARSQIKLVREFEKAMKEIKLNELFSAEQEITSASIVNALMKVAIKDEVMNSVDKCFQIAHPNAFDTAKKNAKNDEYAPKKPTPLDLFSLEDILSAILPLFLGLIKKGANLLTLLAQ
tara:strand:- start:1768 stop:2289 length:522 start_codon:yes stop_codon:yes gene_type:complete